MLDLTSPIYEMRVLICNRDPEFRGHYIPTYQRTEEQLNRDVVSCKVTGHDRDLKLRRHGLPKDICWLS